MPSDELNDSGVESSAMSREDSPNSHQQEDRIPSSEEDQANTSVEPLSRNVHEEEDFEDETLSERLWGLTEMFPETIRSGVGKFTEGTFIGVKWLYGFSRSATWVLFSSSLILVAPVIFEMERSQMEEMQRQQQRQILLGPRAAMSGNPGLLGVPSPPPVSQR